MVRASKVLQLTLRKDASLECFKQSANKLSQICQSKMTFHRPNSLAKAMDGLIKYIENRAGFARVWMLGIKYHLKQTHVAFQVHISHLLFFQLKFEQCYAVN